MKNIEDGDQDIPEREPQGVEAINATPAHGGAEAQPAIVTPTVPAAQTENDLALETAMPQILELRRKNGLIATREAVLAALQSTEFTHSWKKKRGYWKAGGGASPIGINTEYLEAKLACPITGEKYSPKAQAAGKPAVQPDAVPMIVLATYLYNGRYPVTSVTDNFTQKIEVSLPAQINALNPKFGAEAQQDPACLALEIHPDGKRIILELGTFLKHNGIFPLGDEGEDGRVVPTGPVPVPPGGPEVAVAVEGDQADVKGGPT